ncbi:M42 family metallopeptidase [Salinithrix halophila]|uniref:M42 family metallopeptidase n=1 Tax=Salinithrix halophila TaxID=1485204 RepID=A0ABV8JGG1_9BACL
MDHALKALVDLPGPAGREQAVRQWLRERWEGQVQECREDRVGNLICKVGGQGPKLLIQAHMDEIGFIVRHISSSGFLFLDPVQEAHRSSPLHLYMMGQTAQVIGRKGVVATGVFAAPSGHVLTSAHVERPLDYNGFFVDLGVDSREEAEEKGVDIGAGVIWHRPVTKMGTRYVGKALDDRVGLLVMDLLLDQLHRNSLNYEVWFGATVQEENKAHGAYALGQSMEFDLAIPLDIGLVGDIPTVNEQNYPTRLGAGPTLVYKDGAIHYHEDLLWKLEKAAQKYTIPYQKGVYQNYGSDGIAFYDRGIPAALIGIPTRYTHTAFEMVDQRDIKATVDLLQAFIGDAH